MSTFGFLTFEIRDGGRRRTGGGQRQSEDRATPLAFPRETPPLVERHLPRQGEPQPDSLGLRADKWLEERFGDVRRGALSAVDDFDADGSLRTDGLQRHLLARTGCLDRVRAQVYDRGP